jgi:hypothetical protein
VEEVRATGCSHKSACGLALRRSPLSSPATPSAS